MVNTGTGTASSTAALIVHRPSREPDTQPVNRVRPASLSKAATVRSSSQEATHCGADVTSSWWANFSSEGGPRLWLHLPGLTRSARYSCGVRSIPCGHRLTLSPTVSSGSSMKEVPVQGHRLTERNHHDRSARYRRTSDRRADELHRGLCRRS